MDCQMICKLIESINKYRRLDIYHKIILIKDFLGEE